MGDYADTCTKCPHRREDHRDDYDEPYCRTCLNDVVMDGMWEDDERREGIFHLFGLKELDPAWYAQVCKVCEHLRSAHGGGMVYEAYCLDCRSGISHSFDGEPETYDSADSADDDDCWHPECGVCAERRARREFLSEMLQVMDTGVASFKMIRDLLEDEGHLSFLAQRLASQVEEMREVIKVELNGTH